MLLPTNIVEIKLFGFLKKIDKIRDEIPPFRSSSNRNLSTEMKEPIQACFATWRQRKPWLSKGK